jgi:prophage tail gpP-like protein
VATQHTVSLTLRGGKVVDTWAAYDVTIDMLAPGSPWTFELFWSRSARSTWSALNESALVGEQLYLSIDGATQLSGEIERRVERTSREGASMVLSGRDLAGPLQDADADPSIVLRGHALDDALVALAGPSQVSLFITDAANAVECQAIRNRRRSMARRPRRQRVDLTRIRPGDKVWWVMSRLCRKAGFLCWTAPYPEEGAGIGVVVDAPNTSTTPLYAVDRYEQGTGYAGRVLDSERTINLRGVPSEVTAYTHSALTSGQDARMRTLVFNERLVHPLVVADPLPRPRFIRSPPARSVASVRRVAERLVSDAMADFEVYECTVQGHGQGDRLWAVNSPCLVSDDFHGIDKVMLITSVHFHGSRQRGQFTKLRMVPIGAIKVTPEEAAA